MLKTKIAVVGIGAMGRGIVQVVQRSADMEIVAVADINQQALENVKPFLPVDALISTNPFDVLNKKPDVLVEASPSITEAALLLRSAIAQGINIVLMNGEVDQVFGRLLAKDALDNGVILTSDAGDQHGVLARKIEEIRSMGLEVIMAGNNKGFLNRYANPTTLIEEAAKRRLSPTQCTAYTDGTKLSIEMAIVANATGFGLLQPGMVGPRTETVDGALKAFDLDKARKLGGVVDYVLGAKPGASVFVIAYSDDPEDNFFLDYYKMGKGPYYLFLRPYHLCHFETPYAIQRISKYKEPVLVQKKRYLEVGTRAKIDLKKGTVLDGIGGYHTYGVLEKPNSLPIGLSKNTVLKREKKKDEPIEWDDVDFPNNDRRLALWNEQEKVQ
jgi:predicted homoserine dehydrogenase-like protein